MIILGMTLYINCILLKKVNPMAIRRLVIIFSFFLIISLAVSGIYPNTHGKTFGDQRFGYWPMTQGNAQHNGRVDDDTLPNAGEFIWKYKLPLSDASSPTIDSEGNLYIYGLNKTMKIPMLLCLSPNGTEKWYVLIHAGLKPYSGPVIGENGTIYITAFTHYPSGEDYLYAISPKGKILWRYDFKGYGPASVPVIGRNGIIYINANTKDGSTYAIYPNGTLWWVKNIGSLCSRDPAIAPDGTIYVFSLFNKSSLYALNPDGSVKWVYNYNKEIYGSIPVVGDDGTVYFKFRNWTAIDPKGKLKWTTNVHGSLPAIGSNVLYLTRHIIKIPGTSNDLYAVSKENGKILWKLKIDRDNTTAAVYATPPAVDKNENIYLGDWYSKNNTGYLYSISPDGKMRWKLRLDAGIVATPVIGCNKTVYVGTINGTVYAIKYTDTATPITPTSDYTDFLLWGGVGAAVAGVIILPYYRYRRRRS